MLPLDSTVSKTTSAGASMFCSSCQIRRAEPSHKDSLAGGSMCRNWRIGDAAATSSVSDGLSQQRRLLRRMKLAGLGPRLQANAVIHHDLGAEMERIGTKSTRPVCKARLRRMRGTRMRRRDRGTSDACGCRRPTRRCGRCAQKHRGRGRPRPGHRPPTPLTTLLDQIDQASGVGAWIARRPPPHRRRPFRVRAKGAHRSTRPRMKNRMARTVFWRRLVQSSWRRKCASSWIRSA